MRFVQCLNFENKIIELSPKLITVSEKEFIAAINHVHVLFPIKEVYLLFLISSKY